jgi:hypothetical protein
MNTIILLRTASITALMMEALRTSETSVNFNVTIRRYIPKTLNFKYLSVLNKLITVEHRKLLSLTGPVSLILLHGVGT